MAVIYEPRGREYRGRMAYIGYALISRPPRPSTDTPHMWTVDYDQGIELFSRLVPRRINGTPVESWLHGKPSIVASGNAVRELPEDDLRRILALAEEPSLAAVLGVGIGAGRDASLPDVQRTRRVAVSIERDVGFRRSVLTAYDCRCAVTGLGGERRNGPSTRSLVHAAHIKPAAHGGPDDVRNGIALTPTVHSLFDAGLFTLKYVANRLVVVVSSDLSVDALMSPYSDGQALRIRDGQPVTLPHDKECRPDPDMLKYHRQTVFRA